MIQNPFIESSEVEFIKEVSKERLIKAYQNAFSYDISYIFSNTDAIKLYKCKKSGYKFFYPFNITGDSKFYEKLQENEWYYMPWKWEHQICSEYINEGANVLELGSGKGDFIKKISETYKNVNSVGLELNESSVHIDTQYKILNQTIQKFSKENEAKFDIVCSFQVLEHIPMVYDFLNAKIKCLKKNGLLFISVPNNDSFIQYEKFSILNMPPHHMGLWNEKSLKMIGDCFNLDLIKVEFEPLQKYHYNFYLNTMLRKNVGDFLRRCILKILKLIKLKEYVIRLIDKKASKIHGHTVLIVFRKK